MSITRPHGPAACVSAATRFQRSARTAAVIAALSAPFAQAAPTLEEKVEALTQEVEQLKKERAGAQDAGRTTIGGYGELHYNNLEGEGGASNLEELDFHRFVLFFGHRFSDAIRFYSELEVEHAFLKDNASGTASPGEVELEQAYIEFAVTDELAAKGGIFLVPVGILNETHEPPTFYGVERNPVENKIVPSTWWVGGAAVSGRVGGGLSYDLAAHEGLKTNSGKKYAVRDGRQKTAKATANDLAYSARLKWTGVPGLELATTAHLEKDITQGADPNAGEARLLEAHAVWTAGPFGLRALYATWDLDGSGPQSVGADEQTGWYVEPSFKLTPKLGVFARYSLWDNQAGDAVDSKFKQTDAGVNYWPHPNVVLKADYQSQDNDDGKNQNGFNLGIGYMF
jgi:hypothetical protein